MIIVLLGESAVGKDTIANKISEDLNIPIAVSFTTRPKREGEIDGVTYNYITNSELTLKILNNEVMEHTEYVIESEHKIYKYGVTKDELLKSDNVLVILNPIGYKQVLKSDLRDKIISIHITCDNKTRLLRAINRETNVNIDEVIDRYVRDRRDFREQKLITDYTVENKDFATAITKIENIIKEHLKCHKKVIR